MPKPAILHFLAIFTLWLPVSVAEEPINDRLAAETSRVAKELAKDSKLALPPLPNEEEPPPDIAEGGEDFIKAWRIWRLVALKRPGEKSRQLHHGRSRW